LQLLQLSPKPNQAFVPESAVAYDATTLATPLAMARGAVGGRGGSGTDTVTGGTGGSGGE
jgi:hypothetical protein